MSGGLMLAEKIFIALNAPPAFQLRQKVLGDNNANLQYIVTETKANISLRGRGSGFIEQNGAESNEALHMLVEHKDQKGLSEARNLAKNLIETIQQDLHIFIQSNQSTVQIQQQPPPIIQTSTQQITIPQTVQTFAVPPPTIIQQQPTHIIQQQNFIPQSQIIPHNVPMQIIQQTPINIPPPIRTTAPIVQFQGQPNIQIQSANAGQQLLLNQPTQQYQLQYIPATNQITNAPQMQTIQHVLQPQQQIQGILQPSANGQQFIAVQGNATSFMIPPPNIIQQAPPQNINAVFNPTQAITINQEDIKNDPTKIKSDGGDQKSNLSPQQITRIVTSIPPPVLNCPPPQIFNHQQPTQQQFQQFIVNTNPWPQQQPIQQLPINSQIQIVTQPQAIRSGNEIVIQNPIQAGQPVITTFNPQHGGQQFQQIHFHQAAITQPPPTTQMQTVHQMQTMQPSQQNMTFQQHFEQKIISSEVSPQQRSVKRKFDGELEPEANKNFPKTGMGSSLADRSSPPKAKNRMLPPNMQQQQTKINTGPPTGPSGNIQNKPMFNRNLNATLTNASVAQKNVITTAENKILRPPMKSENETSETAINFPIQAQQSFIMRQGNQNYRFAGPQNFIHQQPPPISQSSQFNGPRGQIMSSSNMSLYQNACQSQMLQPPPPPPPINSSAPSTAPQQFIQQDVNVYQPNNNFHPNTQQVNVTRFNVPPQQQQQQNHQGADGSSGMMTGNYQQQPRFRQW